METIKDILREMRAWTVDTDGLAPEEVSLNVSAFADRIEAAYNREQVTNRNHLNGEKSRETNDWLNQLASLINGEINHYMSQGAECFSVDCEPWHIKYDNTKGEVK